MLGGEHLVTLGAFRAVAEKFPDVHVIHFDAHADLREDYLGVSLSHACVLRRCWELVGNGRIFQFGIRSGDREEFQWGRTHVKTNRFDFATLEEVIDQLQDKPVYFTLDSVSYTHLDVYKRQTPIILVQGYFDNYTK